MNSHAPWKRNWFQKPLVLQIVNRWSDFYRTRWCVTLLSRKKVQVPPLQATQGGQRYSSTQFKTSELKMGFGGQRHAPAALPPPKTRHPLYRRLGVPQGRSGRVRKISPLPGFDPGPSSPQRVAIPTELSRPPDSVIRVTSLLCCYVCVCVLFCCFYFVLVL